MLGVTAALRDPECLLLDPCLGWVLESLSVLAEPISMVALKRPHLQGTVPEGKQESSGSAFGMLLVGICWDACQKSWSVGESCMLWVSVGGGTHCFFLGFCEVFSMV